MESKHIILFIFNFYKTNQSILQRISFFFGIAKMFTEIKWSNKGPYKYYFIFIQLLLKFKNY